MKSKILFIVAGCNGIGMGHIYRTIDLYKEFKCWDTQILCTLGSMSAFNLLHCMNFRNIILQRGHKSLLEYIIDISPEVVIHDILDTDSMYISMVRELGVKVVTIEDCGSGSYYTNLTINAIYDRAKANHILYGHNYFDLRDEFILNSGAAVIKPTVSKILLTFGGEDPNNISLKVLKILLGSTITDTVHLEIITGPAYKFHDELHNYISSANRRNIYWFKSVTSGMSKHMLSSDIVISSNGRTVYELCALGIPSIVISANEREAISHKFANSVGFINLGLYSLVSGAQLIDAITFLMHKENRIAIHKSSKSIDLRQGKKRIAGAIKELISNKNAEYYKI